MLEALKGRVIGVAGWKDTGKTILMERLVGALTHRGFSVGTVKHVHEAPALQPAAKDSARHLDAGAEIALALGDQILVLAKHAGEDLETAAARFLSLCDVVLVEGFKHAGFPKIVVVPEGEEVPGDFDNVVAAVYRDRKPEGYPAYTVDETEDLLDLLLERRILELPGRGSALLVNGKSVPMNEFVQTSLAGIVRGFISALHDVEPPATIQLSIKL
jgi:molybdopterin-guanine dinucleotide biosynthesis protein B